MDFTGGCHCGAVRYRCDAEPLRAGFCQCSDCRRLSGAGHGASLAVPTARVQWQGSPRVYTHPTDSGRILTRAFCGTCGTPLYSVDSVAPEVLNLRASTLDDPAVFRPTSVAWTDSAVPWDALPPGLERHPRGRPPLGPRKD